MRELYRLSLPVIGLQLLNVMAILVDTIMCGNLPGEEGAQALVALGFSGQMAFLLVVVMIGLTVGAVALCARAHGAGDRRRVVHVLHQASQLTLLLGAFMTISGLFFAEPLIRLLGASEGTVIVAMRYFLPLLIGTTPMYLRMLYGSVLRAVGNTRLPFLISLGMNGLNVPLNFVLIFGVGDVVPAYGIAGAAYGTVIAQTLGCVVMWLLIRRGDEPSLAVLVGLRKIDRAVTKQLIAVGAPSALDMVVLNFALLVIVALLGRADEMAVAAHGIGMRIQSFAFVPGLGVSQATGALVGQGLGAGDVARVRRVIAASAKLSVGILSVIGALIALFAYPLVELFGVPRGTRLAELSVSWMYLLACGMPLVGGHFAFNGLYQGSGRTNTGLLINATSTLLFQIPLSFLLGPVLGFGPLGVWVAFPASYVLKVIMGFVAYKRGRWVRVGLHT